MLEICKFAKTNYKFVKQNENSKFPKLAFAKLHYPIDSSTSAKQILEISDFVLKIRDILMA
jgi:hypothetical protein